MNMNIEKFAGINIVIAVTENFIFLTSSFILWIVNVLVLLFWNLCVLDKLKHCFLQIYKDIWKKLKSIIIIVVIIIVTVIDIIIIISMLNIIAELTQSSEVTLISFFICLLISEVHIGKL